MIKNGKKDLIDIKKIRLSNTIYQQKFCKKM